MSPSATADRSRNASLAPAARAATAVGRPATAAPGPAATPLRGPARHAPPRPATGRRPAAAAAGRVAPRSASPRAGRPLASGRAASLLDRVLRGPAWIAVVGVLLVGVVFLNVGVLELNRKITRTAERTTEAKRENERLRQRVARLGSSERIQQAAVAQGLVLPPPGSVRYVRADPVADAERAAQGIGEPVSPGPVVAAASSAGGGAAPRQQGG